MKCAACRSAARGRAGSPRAAPARRVAGRGFPAAPPRPSTTTASDGQRGEQEDRLPAEAGVEQAADQRAEASAPPPSRWRPGRSWRRRGSRSNRSRMMARRPRCRPTRRSPAGCARRSGSPTVGIDDRRAGWRPTVSASPPSITGRRPNRSDSGPITSCATASAEQDTARP